MSWFSKVLQAVVRRPISAVSGLSLALCACSGYDGGGSGSSLTVEPAAVGDSTYTLTVTTPSAFSAITLVFDSPGTDAWLSEPEFASPWEIAFGPTMAARLADNRFDTSTLHDGNGNARLAGIVVTHQLCR